MKRTSAACTEFNHEAELIQTEEMSESLTLGWHTPLPIPEHSNGILLTIRLTPPVSFCSSYLPCLLILIPVNSSAWNQTQSLNDHLTSSSSDTSRARRAPAAAAMTLSTASSSEKRSKKRNPASSSRCTTLPFKEEANSPALAWKVWNTEPVLKLSHHSACLLFTVKQLKYVQVFSSPLYFLLHRGTQLQFLNSGCQSV